MSEQSPQTLALIVRQAPYTQRSARAQLDFALAAATLELPLEIYFIGDAAWQLVRDREPEAAGLPRGLKGWAAISTMTRISFFAEPARVKALREHGAATVVDLEGVDLPDMSDRWRQCRQVMSL